LKSTTNLRNNITFYARAPHFSPTQMTFLYPPLAKDVENAIILT